MVGITLAQAEAKLQTWMDAEDKVASGQSYSINNRSLSRADLSHIRDTIDFWERKVQRLSRGGLRVQSAVPKG